MRKAKNLVFLVTVLVLLNSGPAVIASNDESTERTELRETSVTPRPTKAFQETKQEKKTLWTEMKKKQVEMITQRIQTELDLRYKIILKFKEKIGQRITDKSTTNDMASASAKLAQFSDVQYQADMTTLKSKLTEITASNTPKALLPGVKEAANKVRTSLRSMHLFLVEVMKLVATAPKK